MELFRIVQDQANLYSYRATQNEDRAAQLEALIESTKPTNSFSAWHPLIATPFRYSPPHPNARFCPHYGKNIFMPLYLKKQRSMSMPFISYMNVDICLSILTLEAEIFF